MFKALYVDRAGIFGGPKRCNFSQVKRACSELGVQIIFANSPQGKGRIERAFDTFQDRLVPELRLNDIEDMESANRHLHDVFIPSFWRDHIEVISRSEESEFMPVPAHINLDDVCIVKDYRRIRSDHTFSYANKFYLIESPLKHSIAKQKIEIRTGHDEGFDAYFAGRHLAVSEVIEPTKPSMFDLDIQKKLEVLQLAEKLQNVSEAARLSGVSRDTIYRHRKLIKDGGIQALKRQVRTEHYHQNRTDQAIANTVIEFSLDNPHQRQAQISNQLKKHYQIELSATGVRNVWLRENMQTCALRLHKKESLSAAV